MKKFFTVLVCTFLLLLNENSFAETKNVDKTKKANEKVIVLETKKEENETVEQEEMLKNSRKSRL